VLDALKANMFISGGAHGIDTYCCVEAVRRFPKAHHKVVRPWNYRANEVHAAWCRRQQAEGIDIEIIDLERPKRLKPHPNVQRNQFMLALAAALNKSTLPPRLVAFPGGPEEVLRSGTWSTICRARRMPVDYATPFDVEIHPLSEADGTLVRGLVEL